MTRRTYETTLQLVDPLSELAACRGMVRENTAEPSLLETYAMLRAILSPILGSLTPTELEEIHHSAEEGVQVLFKPLPILKCAVKSWGRRSIDDERFGLWTSPGDIDNLDTSVPEICQIDNTSAEPIPEAQDTNIGSAISWISTVKMDDRIAEAILSFGTSSTQAAPTTTNIRRNKRVKAHQIKAPKQATEDPSSYDTTLPNEPTQHTEASHPYSSMAPSTVVSTRTSRAHSRQRSTSSVISLLTLPPHILKRKPAIFDLRVAVTRDATASNHDMNIGCSQGQDVFMRRQFIKATESNVDSTRTHNLEPHSAQSCGQWVIPMFVNSSMPDTTNYKSYLVSSHGTELHGVIDSLSLLAPPTGAVTSSSDGHADARRDAVTRDAWWTSRKSKDSSAPTHTSNAQSDKPSCEFAPDHPLNSLSLLAPSTASLSPSTLATSAPVTPLRTPHSSTESLLFEGWAAEWDSKQHQLWSSALASKKQQSSEAMIKLPRTHMATKTKRSFRQRLNALWTH